MTDRAKALEALDLMRRNWDCAVGQDDTEAMRVLRAAIDIAHPNEEEPDFDEFEIPEVDDWEDPLAPSLAPTPATELARLVMEWWEKHQFDEYGDPENPANVYEDEPEAVKAARAILGTESKSTRPTP